MAVQLQDKEAVAEFLEYLAAMIRRGQISAFNALMFEDGSGRVSMEFPPGVDVPAVLRGDTEEDFDDPTPTEPTVVSRMPRKP